MTSSSSYQLFQADACEILPVHTERGSQTLHWPILCICRCELANNVKKGNGSDFNTNSFNLSALSADARRRETLSSVCLVTLSQLSRWRSHQGPQNAQLCRIS